MATQITKTHLAAFAFPAMISAIMHGPIAGILPSLYASTFAIDLTVIGSILLAARVFDAVTDPVIGFLSDRTVSKHGRRKPWFAGGSILTVLCVYFLFTPGADASTGYFLTFSLLLYLAWTIMEIPYAAWALELSRDTKQRTKINAWRTAALFVGGVLFTIAPALVPAAEGNMNFEVLGVLAIILAVAIPLSTFVAFKFVPQGDVYESETPPRLAELWNSVKENRPFQMFALMYVFIGLASGIGNTLAFMYIANYLEIGDRYTELFLPATLIGPITLPFWVWILNKFGKHKTTAVAFTIYAALMPLPWFVDPGPESFMPMMILFAAGTAFMPLLMVSMPAILGDVVDYDELNTGKNRAGQYNAFLAMISKGVAAIGGPVAFLIVGLWGYQPGSPDNDADAIWGLRFVYNILPPLVVLPGIIILYFFPINDKRQKEMRLEIERRAQAAAE